MKYIITAGAWLSAPMDEQENVFDVGLCRDYASTLEAALEKFSEWVSSGNYSIVQLWDGNAQIRFFNGGKTSGYQSLIEATRKD